MRVGSEPAQRGEQLRFIGLAGGLHDGDRRIRR
jgi:hypothetical protein